MELQCHGITAVFIGIQDPFMIRRRIRAIIIIIIIIMLLID